MAFLTSLLGIDYISKFLYNKYLLKLLQILKKCL